MLLAPYSPTELEWVDTGIGDPDLVLASAGSSTGRHRISP